MEMTLDLAERAARAAQARARDLGTPMTVAVVDEGGRLVLCARGDGAGFLTTETARAKAVAAAAFRRPTRETAELWAQSSAFWALMPGVVPEPVLPTTGAVPIRRQGRLVGAIGCGGGTGDQDHACAEAGAAAVETA